MGRRAQHPPNSHTPIKHICALARTHTRTWTHVEESTPTVSEERGRDKKSSAVIKFRPAGKLWGVGAAGGVRPPTEFHCADKQFATLGHTNAHEGDNVRERGEREK